MVVARNGMPRRSRRARLSLAVMALGALLLLLVPMLLVALAFAQVRDVELPGTLVILSATGGMALIVIGAALWE